MIAAPNQTVLVVDDDPQIRKLLGAVLKRAGYHVSTAANGATALEALDNQAVDLVIMDLIMPEKEGIETIMEMKKRKLDMPLIAISGGGKLSPQTYLDIAKGLGATETMQKPIDIAKLAATVKALLTNSPENPG